MFINSNAPALCHNLRKAQGVWQRISWVLHVENIRALICAMFYRVLVMAVLLYRSKNWKVPKAEMEALEGFHVAAARNLT